jgi:uncharacterized membrane protein
MGHFNDAANPTIVIPPTPPTPAQIKAQQKADAAAAKATAAQAANLPAQTAAQIGADTSSTLNTVLKVGGIAVAVAIGFVVLMSFIGRKK